MPLKFNCKYIDDKGKEKTPVLIHRTIMGSFERFMGILIEHYAGAFPVWLSPVQAIILPVSEKFDNYAKSIYAQLATADIRVKLDNESESLGKRIHNAEKQKIPYMLIVGEKESTEKNITVRQRGVKEQYVLKLEKFIEKISKEIAEKTTN